MKVLINALSARRGGIVTYTRNVTAALVARGVDVVIAAPSDFEMDRDRGEHIGIDVYDHPPLRRAIWEQLAWRRTVSRIAPDVLFSSANYALLLCPVPQVLLIREGGLFDPFYLANVAPAQGMEAAVMRNLRRRLMIRSGRQADCVLTPSETTREQFLMWAPDLRDKVAANHYGAPVDTFAFRPPPPQGERAAIRLLYVSVYYPHKAPWVLIRAVERLDRDGVPVTATITMTEAEISARPGGALDRATFRSATTNGAVNLGAYAYASLPALYHGHDIFVFPSVNETFGHPMAEAMSAGLPIIAADTAINREICAEAALYFTPFSDRDLARQIQVLADDADLRARLVAAGRARVESEFRWDDHVERLVASFEAAIAGPARE